MTEPAAGGSDDRAAFLRALRALDEALDENIERARMMKRRISDLESACATGRPIREIVPAEQTPLLVQLLTESGEDLQEYGAQVRRTEARVLYHEGMSMEQIGRLFGVSRQRVSVLLRSREEELD